MIKIIVALSVANVLRWHSTTTNHMVASKSLRGAGLLTKLGKRSDNTMEKITWSGVTSAYEHKHRPNAILPESTKLGFRKVWLLDAQWSTCPVEVEDQVKALWSWYENGNDRFVIKTNLGDLKDFHENENYKDGNKFIKTNAIVQYAEEMGIVDDEDEILIHWWW